jgi:GH43 family beta-xylosidase
MADTKKRRMPCILALLIIFITLFPSNTLGAGSTAMIQNAAETPYVSFNEYFYNPIRVDYMLGDPWMTYHDGMYYYSQSGGDHVGVVSSPTISGLMSRRQFTKRVYLGVQNAQTELWASELHYYQGRWYSFFAADHDNDNTYHRMYVLRSRTDDAMGEWDFIGKMDLPEDQWAIDGTFFENADGRIFLIWSGWKNDAQGKSLWKQYLYIAELKKEDPTKVISTERVMISKPEYYWEKSKLPQNEGPVILKSPKGTVYCVYAANFSGSDEYALGMLRLTGRDPMDASAWEKLPEPLMAPAKDIGVYGPGHCSFTKSPDGTEDWMIYHAAKASGSGWDRSARAQKVEWVNDTPYMGRPLSLGEKVKLPSGEVVDRIMIQAEDAELTNNSSVTDVPGVGKTVHFTGKADQCNITVRVEKDGDYAFYVRHSNNTENESSFWVSVNGGPDVTVPASRSGGPGQFVMACAVLPLKEGLNTLSVTAGQDVDMDLFILDREKVVK